MNLTLATHLKGFLEMGFFSTITGLFKAPKTDLDYLMDVTNAFGSLQDTMKKNETPWLERVILAEKQRAADIEYLVENVSDHNLFGYAREHNDYIDKVIESFKELHDMTKDI